MLSGLSAWTRGGSKRAPRQLAQLDRVIVARRGEGETWIFWLEATLRANQTNVDKMGRQFREVRAGGTCIV